MPLVFSYHTDLQVYADRYVPWPVLNQLARGLTAVVLPTVLNWADLCLCTSPQLKEQLEGIGVRNLDVWRKGIDTDVFNPKFNEDNGEMRAMLSGGEPSRPLLLYVGRLGTEKNVGLVREVLRRIPDARLAVVGAGPAEEELRETFAGTDTIFTGLLQGEKLSRACAAAPRPRALARLPPFALGPLLLLLARSLLLRLTPPPLLAPPLQVRGGGRLRDAVRVGDARLRRPGVLRVRRPRGRRGRGRRAEHRRARRLARAAVQAWGCRRPHREGGRRPYPSPPTPLPRLSHSSHTSRISLLTPRLSPAPRR